MNKFWIITKETLRRNLKSIGFIAMVFVPLLIMSVLMAVIYFNSDTESEEGSDEPTNTEIALITQEEGIEAHFTSEGMPLNFNTDYPTVDEANQALIDEKVDGVLSVTTNEQGLQADLDHSGISSSERETIEELVTQTQITKRSKELDLAPEETQYLFEPVDFNDRSVTIRNNKILSEEESIDSSIQLASAYIICTVIFIIIAFYSGIISEEIAREKGSRIMEIFLSSATATQHFFGKLIGVILMLLIQLAIYVAFFGLALYLFRNNSIVEMGLSMIDIGEFLGEFVGYSLIFFILGIAMYIIISAFLGSLVSKVEDSNKFITPLIFTMLAGFYLGMYTLNVPENIVSVVGSHFPLFTPLVMPFRVAADTVSTPELWISIIVSTLFTILLAYLSVVFYRANVLVYSDSNIFGIIKRSWGIIKSNRKAEQENK